MTDLGDLVYTPILSSAAVFDQYMQLGLGLGLGRSMEGSLNECIQGSPRVRVLRVRGACKR